MRELRRHGVGVRPRVTGASGRTISFEGGESGDYDGVVWATGFRIDHSWIDIPEVKNERGEVQHVRGVTDSAGLYLLGMTWQYTRTSALLGWVGNDAAYLADQIEAAKRTQASPGATGCDDVVIHGGKRCTHITRSTSAPTSRAWTRPRAPRSSACATATIHEITIKPVRKRIGDAEVRMLGYNGSIPGPTLHVDQGSEVTIEATNLGDVDATLHWHGLRLENRYDGVPEETQAPIGHGGKFTYRLQFPDPGFYWYHPHIREDFAQEMGLYAGIIVEPSDPDYWPPADRELAITLDDILIEDGQIAPFERSGPTFTAMGRFGNVMLINGETDYRAEAKAGEVVRLHLVDTANTRIFNFGDQRRPDEARRRRQRPGRARGVHRRGPALAV